VTLRDILTLRLGADGLLVAEPAGHGFLFGGLTLGIALRAAAQSIAPGMVAKSLHAYFLRAGVWGTPTTLQVTEESNGRTFCARHVRVRQEDRTLAVVTVSFHVPAAGADWQVGTPGHSPDPDVLPPYPVVLPAPDLIEVRCLDEVPGDGSARPVHPFWARSIAPLGEDPISHSAALAFISDYLVIFSLLGAPDPIANPRTIRTVDHSVWFHRPANAEDWLLFTSDPVSIAGGRGLAQGTVHARTGARVASFTQEVIIPP
jgi:acyl-CoA thioesterase-2